MDRVPDSLGQLSMQLANSHNARVGSSAIERIVTTKLVIHGYFRVEELYP